jgi:signal transduction histidine kinase
VAELDAARRREAAAADAAARTQERTRVAREMHDVVSHQVSLIAVAAGALRVGGHPPAVTSAAETIRQLAVRTSDELRAMLLSLRSTAHDPRLEGLPGLGDLGELWARTGLDGSCDVEGRLVAEVPASVQHQLFRVVQEALTNVHRHAPGALTTVTVAQDRNSGDLVVGVLNAPGDGPSPGGGRIGGSGHGILGMHERVGLVGGRLRVGPTGDGGFEVVACVPPSAVHRG